MKTVKPFGDGDEGIEVGGIDIEVGVVSVEETLHEAIKNQTAYQFHPHPNSFATAQFSAETSLDFWDSFISARLS